MTIVDALNALVLGLFIVVTISMTVVRQVGACMQAFVGQSLLLAASAFLLGSSPLSWHLIALGCVTLVSKVLLIPWLLGTLVPTEIHRRREITQALDVPISLLLALGLSFVAYFLGEHLVRAAPSLASAAQHGVVVRGPSRRLRLVRSSSCVDGRACRDVLREGLRDGVLGQTARAAS
jgi:hydrogenase-4 membrane subunit HyfE